MDVILYFIIGFALGVFYRKRYHFLYWLRETYFSIWAAIYYRPKVRRYRKLIERRGWTQANPYDAFAEWSHPEKGTKYFYSAVCLEAGKKVRI